MKEMLRQKMCELAFIRETDEVDEVMVKIRYAVDTMVAVLPITHPLAKQTVIRLGMLADEEFLLIQEKTTLYKLGIQACKQSGFTPKIAYTDHKIENLVDLVIQGMGVALLMKQLALYVASSKIAILDITPAVSTKIILCHLKGVELSDAAKHFIVCARSQGLNGGISGQQDSIPSQIFEDYVPT